MHTVELLEQAIAVARRSGFSIRQDWFGGAAAGVCRFKGKEWIFIDLALGPREQLEQVLDALRKLPNRSQLEAPQQLQTLLKVRKAA